MKYLIQNLLLFTFSINVVNAQHSINRYKKSLTQLAKFALKKARIFPKLNMTKNVYYSQTKCYKIECLKKDIRSSEPNKYKIKKTVVPHK